MMKTSEVKINGSKLKKMKIRTKNRSHHALLINNEQRAKTQTKNARNGSPLSVGFFYDVRSSRNQGDLQQQPQSPMVSEIEGERSETDEDEDA